MSYRSINWKFTGFSLKGGVFVFQASGKIPQNVSKELRLDTSDSLHLSIGAAGYCERMWSAYGGSTEAFVPEGFYAHNRDLTRQLIILDVPESSMAMLSLILGDLINGRASIVFDAGFCDWVNEGEIAELMPILPLIELGIISK